jgi:hypothetical protein
MRISMGLQPGIKRGKLRIPIGKLGYRMAVLKLQLLGGFKVMNEAGREIVISARKGRALLAEERPWIRVSFP